MRKEIIRGALSALLATSVLPAQSTGKPEVHQRAERSRCSNIVALSGSVNIRCSDLTPEQRKLIESIPGMLNKIVSNQLDPTTVMSKLNEIEAAQKQRSQTVYAPNGIGSIGGTLINPTVNNFGPPRANLTFTEEVLQPLPNDGKGFKELVIHIHTDRPIPGATIGVVMSDPITLTSEYYKAHNASVVGGGVSQVDLKAPLYRAGTPVPNSFALRVGMPSALDPGIELRVPVQSQFDAHVLEIEQVGP